MVKAPMPSRATDGKGEGNRHALIGGDYQLSAQRRIIVFIGKLT
jgi:hypothetical protein